MSAISKDFLTMNELAAQKKVTVRTVQNWVKAGIAPPYEILDGKKWFYKKATQKFKMPGRGRPKKRRAAMRRQ